VIWGYGKIPLEREVTMKPRGTWLWLAVLLLCGSGYFSQAVADPHSFEVFLRGNIDLEAGTITNLSDNGLAMESISYSFGAAEDGVATWDAGQSYWLLHPESVPEGVKITKSNDLTDPRYFQTITFSEFSIAPGGSFSFHGIDIDLIVDLSPLLVDGSTIDTVGRSLRNAFISVTFSDGETSRGALHQTPWTVDQRWDPPPPPLPEPSTGLLLVIGLAGLWVFRSRRAIHNERCFS
jgi:hypothetical protein